MVASQLQTTLESRLNRIVWTMLDNKNWNKYFWDCKADPMVLFSIR